MGAVQSPPCSGWGPHGKDHTCNLERVRSGETLAESFSPGSLSHADMVTPDRRRLLGALGGGAALGLAGCLEASDDGGRAGPADATDRDGAADLVLAATTSAQDSGLLAALLAGYESAGGARVRPVIRGSGAALRTARDGDADVALVHAPDAEDAFLRAGHGLNRRAVMATDFLVVGPRADPAGVAVAEDAGDAGDAGAAMRAIAGAEATFLSRGDDSGTHAKERELWTRAGVDPWGPWYRATGQGQGETLAAADQQGAYALVDRGTYLVMADRLDLTVHLAGPMAGGPEVLRNPYHVIPVNPDRTDVAYGRAMSLVAYLTGPVGQRRVGEYRIDGRPAFRPTAGPAFDQYVPADWHGD